MKGSAPRGLLYLASTASQIELPAEGGWWDWYPQLDWRLRKWSSRWEQALTSDSLVHKSCLTGRTGLPSIWKGSPFITLVSIGFWSVLKAFFCFPSEQVGLDCKAICFSTSLFDTKLTSVYLTLAKKGGITKTNHLGDKGKRKQTVNDPLGTGDWLLMTRAIQLRRRLGTSSLGFSQGLRPGSLGSEVLSFGVEF